jgi:hypothetical protein
MAHEAADLDERPSGRTPGDLATAAAESTSHGRGPCAPHSLCRPPWSAAAPAPRGTCARRTCPQPRRETAEAGPMRAQVRPARATARGKLAFPSRIPVGVAIRPPGQGLCGATARGKRACHHRFPVGVAIRPPGKGLCGATARGKRAVVRAFPTVLRLPGEWGRAPALTNARSKRTRKAPGPLGPHSGRDKAHPCTRRWMRTSTASDHGAAGDGSTLDIPTVIGSTLVIRTITGSGPTDSDDHRAAGPVESGAASAENARG